MINKTKENSGKNSGGIKRRKFFFYSGSLLLTVGGILKNPLGLFKAGNDTVIKDSSVKITSNPNSIKRKVRYSDNG